MMKINKETIQKWNHLFQAVTEGKVIQINKGDIWVDIDLDGEGINVSKLIAFPECYRIKPEAKYRPFKNAEECWEEIRKHEPFIKYKVIEISKDVYLIIQRIKTDGIETDVERLDFKTAFEWFTFSDGTPFGVKVEV